MTRKITLFLFVIFSFAANAQQDGYQTHFQFNELSYNPSYAGKVKDKICISALWHQQYLGFKSDEIKDISGRAVVAQDKIAPTTQFLNLSTRLFGKLGVAVNLINDKIGPQAFLLPKVNLAWYFNAGGADLAVGASFGQMQKSLDGTRLIALTELQGLGPDPLVPKVMETDRKYDLGFGIHYLNQNIGNLNIGISAAHLLPGEFKQKVNGFAFSSLKTHYYLNAGMEFPIGSSGNLVLQPNILIKYGTKLQADANALLFLNQQFWGGLSYRQGDNANLMIGFMQNDFKVGYAFDFAVTSLKPGSRTTHELFVQYCYQIKLKKPVSRYLINPRHLHDEKY